MKKLSAMPKLISTQRTSKNSSKKISSSFLPKLVFQVWFLFRFEFSYFQTERKVNSVQEALTKFFAVHTLEFEIFQTTCKNKTKNIKIYFMKN